MKVLPGPATLSRQTNIVKRMIVPALLDAFIFGAAYVIAYYAYAITMPALNGRSVEFLVLGALITVVSMSLFGAYRRIWSRTSGHEITLIVKAVVIGTTVIIALDHLITPNPMPTSVILFGAMLTLTGFVAIRYRSRLVRGLQWRWKAIWKGEFPDRPQVLIVGAGESGQVLAMRLKHRTLGADYDLVGFVDDDPAKQGMYVEGSPILGKREDIPTLVEKHKIELIVLAIHNIAGPDFREVLNYCERTSARIKIAPDLLSVVSTDEPASLLRSVQAEDLIGRKAVSRHQTVDISPVMHKRVLITGAAGSIGSELSRQFCMTYEPTQLVLLDNNESGLYDLYIELRARYPQINLVPALVDVSNRRAVKSVFMHYQPEIVFHAAAYKHVPILETFPEEAVQANIIGTRNVAEAALEHRVERFTLISTDKAVNPSSVMGSTKRVCEQMITTLAQKESCQTLYTAVRFGNVLGSRGSVVPTFNRQIDSGGPVTVTHPMMTRYFMSIAEAVNLVIHAACITHGGDLFMLKMGEAVRIVDLAERMIRLRGLRPYRDIEIKFTGMRPGEKLHEELYEGTEDVADTVHPSILNIRQPQHFETPDYFFRRLDDLIEVHLDSDNALSTLRHFIQERDAQPQYEMAMQQIKIV